MTTNNRTTTTESNFTVRQPRWARWRAPSVFYDPDGTPMVRVPVPGLGNAEIEGSVFNALMDRGVSDQWFKTCTGKGNSYVAVAIPEDTDKIITVARLIVTTPARRHVRYVDGNPLNLRRRNLWQKAKEVEDARDADGNLLTGKAKQQANHWMPAEVEARS